MENATFISIIALVVALLIAGVLIWLYKKGHITAANLQTIGDVAEQITEFTSPGSNVSMFAYYASQAVHAVEQLVKNGKLQKDDDVRKAAATELVKEFAAIDGVVLTAAEEKAIDSLIEAQVDKLPSKIVLA